MKPKLPFRKQLRLPNYDYSSSAWYFVTVCTEGKIYHFGEVKNKKLEPNTYGILVKQQWEWLSSRYTDVHLDQFVVMPNHLHGIIINQPKETQIKTISQLVGAFKTTSTKIIRNVGLTEFKWQRSFYEHIIRKQESLDLIRKYIVDNPAQWHLDKYYFHAGAGRDQP